MPKSDSGDQRGVAACCCKDESHGHDAVNSFEDFSCCCIEVNSGGCPVGQVEGSYKDKRLRLWDGEAFGLAKATAAGAWFCEVLCLLCFLEAIKRNQKVLRYCYIGHDEMCMLKKTDGASVSDFTEAARDVFGACKRAAKLCVAKLAEGSMEWKWPSKGVVISKGSFEQS